MTGIALDVLVLPKQGKFGFFVMIERNLFPAALDVARLALRSEFAFVLIVFFMARDAGSLQFYFIQIARVTADAFCLAMLSEQRIFGLLVMIEQDIFPALGIMASFAFGAKVPLMLIVLLMTIVAQTRGIFEFVIDMASLALHIHMFSK